jgi:hypothetical protein
VCAALCRRARAPSAWLQTPFKVLAQNGVFVVLAIATAVGPSIAISMFSYEFPSLIGARACARVCLKCWGGGSRHASQGWGTQPSGAPLLALLTLLTPMAPAARCAPVPDTRCAGGLASVLLTAVLVKFRVGLRPVPPHGDPALGAVHSSADSLSPWLVQGGEVKAASATDACAAIRRKSRAGMSNTTYRCVLGGAARLRTHGARSHGRWPAP